jgi:hypothetical protein
MDGLTFRFAFRKGLLSVAGAPWTSLTTSVVSREFRPYDALVTASEQTG